MKKNQKNQPSPTSMEAVAADEVIDRSVTPKKKKAKAAKKVKKEKPAKAKKVYADLCAIVDAKMDQVDPQWRQMKFPSTQSKLEYIAVRDPKWIPRN